MASSSGVYAALSAATYSSTPQRTSAYNWTPRVVPLNGSGDCYQPAQYVSSYSEENHYEGGTYQPTNGSVSKYGNTVVTEKRKLVIKNISHRGPNDLLRRFVYELAQPFQDYIQEIHIPMDKEGRRRGHAFVTLQSADVALKVQQQLNGQRFQGRITEVTLAKEGVAEQSQHSSPLFNSTPSSSSKHRETEKPKKEKTRQSYSYGSTNGLKDYSYPEVLYPTIEAPASDEKGKSKEKEKVRVKPREKTEPIIADGSSCRGSHSDDSRWS